MNNKFELHNNDGKSCSQVLVYSIDDLKYWIEEAQRTSHLIGVDYYDNDHYVCVIFPKEVAGNIAIRKLKSFDTEAILRDWPIDKDDEVTAEIKKLLMPDK